MRQQRRTAFTFILVPLIAAIIGWLLFVAALFIDLITDMGVPIDELYGPDAAQIFRPSRYLFLAAIAVFAVGALLARKRIDTLLMGRTNASALLRPGFEFAGTAIIIGLVIAAWAAVAVFLESFFEGGTSDVSLPVRIWNTYVPIILYTALVVSVILAAFVFARRHSDAHDGGSPKQKSERAAPAAGAALTSGDAPSQSSQGSDHSREQRFIGLSFSLPIVAVAVALIFGLIVFDVTQTSIPVWIWVIIQTVIAAGIATGTWFARRGMTEMQSRERPLAGAVIGAKNLNFVLSIIFAAIVALMSLGYGASATEQLRVAPSLTVSIYESEPKEPTSAGDEFSLDDSRITLNASDVQRYSDVTVTIEPGSRELLSEAADSEGLFWSELAFPANLEPGSYTLTASAVSADGSEIRRSIPVNISESGTLLLPEGDLASDPADAQPRLMPFSATWIASDLLPAFLLLVLAAAVIAVTLAIRNPDVRNEVAR